MITFDKNKLPQLHQNFIDNSVSKLKSDNRILGVTVGGSILLGTMDEYSDLDLVIVVKPENYEDIIKERKQIISKIDSYLGGFTGEHVGEPRLIIALYGPPLLHVDFKFVSFEDIEDKVENPIIIWERENILSNIIYKHAAKFPSPDQEWIKDRFWIWIHYIAAKIGRGELFETIAAINFIREKVLGPIILERNNARPQGVRRLETHGGIYLDKLKNTIAEYSASSCINALKNVIELYQTLRSDKTTMDVEIQAIAYLDKIENKICKGIK
jgi:predicted nucleotidyltransferase